MTHWRCLAGLAAGLLALVQSSARGIEQQLIDRAVERGVAALRALQTAGGTWVHGSNDPGMTSLAGLAMLESKVSREDPAIRKAVAAVRRACPRMTETYSLALAVLFLDRLGDPADVPIIQILAIRLVHGQSKGGGWGYHCPSLAREAETRVFNGFRKEERPGNAGEIEVSKDVQEVFANYAQTGPANDAVDHSNTQFATLALWVARRYKVPVDPSLKTLELHYRQCQNLDGGWAYHPGEPTSPAMTAAGVLGLAVGDGSSLDIRKRRGETIKTEKLKDPHLIRALNYLGLIIDKPVGQQNLHLVPAATGNSFYFLWSLERVAMCLGLETIGRKDWYNWGAEILVVNQDRLNGQWNGKWSQGGADTCFALLFLTRSNLAKDLSAHLRGLIHDPGQVTLRASEAGEGKNRSAKSGIEVKRGPSLPDLNQAEPGVQPAPPVKSPAAPGSEAARLAADIIRAPDAQLDAVLKRVRDATGVANTEALAAAIPHLTRDGKKRARDALAERLFGMRTSSLANYLKDDDAEIRRAAALALAMKESKEHIPGLIELLKDPQQAVVLGARSALKELTGKDFGPPVGASAEDRARAVAEWNEWWKKNKAN